MGEVNHYVTDTYLLVPLYMYNHALIVAVIEGAPCRIEIMARIRAALVDAQHGQAVALLRAARWDRKQHTRY